MLLQFCAINNLTIANKLYKNKRARLITWISPCGKIRNQIDYITVGKNRLSKVKDFRVFNSADIGSDHNLVIAKLAMKVQKRRNTKKHTIENMTPQLILMCERRRKARL